MTEGWLVRPATLEDLDAVVGFNCDMALETEDRHLDPQRVRLGVERLISTSALGRILVATDAQGALAGTLAVTSEWSDWRNGQFWWIQSVYVLPACRRRGVFSALYQYIEAEARAQEEVCGLRLYVEQENVHAQKTYLNLGMSETHYKMFEVDFQAQ